MDGFALGVGVVGTLLLCLALGLAAGVGGESKCHQVKVALTVTNHTDAIPALKAAQVCW